MVHPHTDEHPGKQCVGLKRMHGIPHIVHILYLESAVKNGAHVCVTMCLAAPVATHS